MSSGKFVNLFPVNDVYAVYQNDDGSLFAVKTPFLGLCENGEISTLSYDGIGLSPNALDSNFQAYGTKESLEAEFNSQKIDFLGETKKPVFQENTADCPDTAPYCPVCGHILMDGNNDHFNYCPDCGQKINWKETQ